MNEKVIIKMGFTPSYAPFRICNMRTFIYIYAFLLHEYYNGKDCELFFQIDDTNPNKRIHSNEEIVTFYKKLGIINDYIPVSIISQTDNMNLCDYYYDKLVSLGFVKIREDGVSCFDIEKYKDIYGNDIVLNDMICGEIKFQVSSIAINDMFAIRRSNGTYLYHFATCIDNINLGLTHIIRGKNKMSSAVCQIIISKCLGIPIPSFIHLPLLLNDKNNTYELNNRSLLIDFLKRGYDVYPVFSYLISSGYGDSGIVYSSIDEFARNFDINKIHHHDGKFDINILNKINRIFYNKIGYDDYVSNIFMTCGLLSCDSLFLDDSRILELGYLHNLNYSSIEGILQSMSNDRFEFLNDREKEILYNVMLKLESVDDINLVVNELSQYSKKEVYKMIRYFYIGLKTGCSCSAIKDFFELKFDYQERVNNINKKIFRKDW